MSKLFFSLLSLVTLYSCASSKPEPTMEELITQKITKDFAKELTNNNFDQTTSKTSDTLIKKFNKLVENNKKPFAIKVNDKIEIIKIEEKKPLAFTFSGKSLIRPFVLNLTKDKESLSMSGYEVTNCFFRVEQSYTPQEKTPRRTKEYLTCRKGEEKYVTQHPHKDDVKSPQLQIIVEDNKISEFIVLYPASLVLKDNKKGLLQYDFNFSEL